MRIKNHPILSFDGRETIPFYFNDKLYYGVEGDTIASALVANNVKALTSSLHLERPRGFYCAIGNCASCNMVVDGEPNVRTCITPLKKDMRVYRQKGRGRLHAKE